MNVQNVVAIITAVVTLATIIFYSGKHSQKYDSLSLRVDNHDDKLDKHGDQIAENEGAIRELKAWRQGYDAAIAKGQQ